MADPKAPTDPSPSPSAGRAAGPSGWGPPPGLGAPYVTYRSWSWRGGGRGQGSRWAGVGLILFGAALLLGQLGSPIGAGSLILAALALLFGYAWLSSGGRWSVVPFAFFAAIAASSILHDLGVVRSSGLTALLLGVAFAAVWLLDRRGPVRPAWAAWLAAIFLLVAAIQLWDTLPGLPQAGDLWPLLLIGLGIALVVRERGRLGRR